MNTRTLEQRKAATEWTRQWRLRKTDLGLCGKCGKEPFTVGTLECDSCHRRSAAASKIRRLERLSRGMCATCGVREHIEGMTRCETCRPKIRQTLEGSRKSHRKTSYGLSPERFKEMFDEQNGRCAICSFEFHELSKGTTPHVDHNHNTGQVRGLLCSSCNRMIGHAKEESARLLNGVSYLSHYEDMVT